ncbi:MAG: methyltransferase domain-containing protein [Oscillochloris sp.]|nr:methyltransferase domain-containing protein [Oscillochloris sp.]
MTLPDANDLFDAHYYATGCGIPYQRDNARMTFFGDVADHIVTEITPTSVFDAGCAIGLLVEQLCLRGVDAQGVDISNYAISNAHDSVRNRVRVGSVSEPLGRRYDLIVSIEVLEHMPRSDAEAAIANFCAHSDDVIFSSSPLDYKEATHFNVNPPEYWAYLFAQHGFYRDVDFDASFLTPWAARFRRRNDPPARIIRDYERRFWELWRANTDLRQLALEQRHQLSGAEARAAALPVAEARAAALSTYEAEITSLHQAAAESSAYACRLERELAVRDSQITQLTSLLRRIENGRIMRILRAFS